MAAIESTLDHPAHATHLFHMRLALQEAAKATPEKTAFCVGALLVDPQTTPYTLLSTGYSRELPGNTHAEQCCLERLGSIERHTQDDMPILDNVCAMYTTMEPCSERNSGNKSCVDRLIESGKIRTVYVGVREPDTFVKKNIAIERLREAGIDYIHVPGVEQECLEAATRGHDSQS